MAAKIETNALKLLLSEFQREVHATAVSKGWWDSAPAHAEIQKRLQQEPHLLETFQLATERNKGEMLALMHSEISEALEALRHGNPPDDKIPQFSGVEAELADTMIRIFDFCEAFGYDVVGAMLAKAEMNKSRTYKHGGKAF